MAQVYYSVGQDNTTNLMTGTPTVTISAGVATFSSAQTGNIGVGDRVTYNTSDVAYISGKTSSTVWTLVTALGATPGDITSSTVVSIKREFNSLSSAYTGSYDANHLNTRDLVTGTYVLNLPCYYDSGADSSVVTFTGWTTSATYYIKLYTPQGGNESNNTQRHKGTWNTSAFRLETTTGGAYILYITGVSYMIIDGLQLLATTSAANGNGIRTQIVTSGDITISNNIVRTILSGNASSYEGIACVSGHTHNIYNNLIYGMKSPTYHNSTGIIAVNAVVTQVVNAYNNTIYDCDYGMRIYQASGSFVFLAKNNLVNNCGTCYLAANGGAFDASSSNNISSDTTAPGTSYKWSVTADYVNIGTNFHLKSIDTVAIGAGIDLSSVFTTDFENETRVTWDVGADEFIGISPALSSGIALSIDPVIVLSSLVISPPLLSCISSTTSPSIILGSLLITPTLDTTISKSASPVVILGSVVITSSLSNCICLSIDPVIVLSSLSISPTIINCISSTTSPSIILGSLLIAPTLSSVITSSVNPVVILGNTLIIVGISSCKTSSVNPVVILENVLIIVGTSSCKTSSVNPVVILGNILIIVGVSSCISRSANPAVGINDILISPTPLSCISSTVSPSIILGSLNISPVSISSIASTINPITIIGSLLISPSILNARVNSINPTILIGNILIIPAYSSCIAKSIDPSVTAGTDVIVSPSLVSLIVSSTSPWVYAGDPYLGKELRLFESGLQFNATIKSHIGVVLN